MVRFEATMSRFLTTLRRLQEPSSVPFKSRMTVFRATIKAQPS